MRSKKVIATLIFVLTVIMMMFMVSTAVFATDIPGENYPEYDFGEVTEGGYDEDPQPQTEFIPETEPPYEEPVETQAEETQAPVDDNDDVDDLPQVPSQEVVIPTSVKLPDIEVSDTSLMGGVIAWLCVAVGIAVIAGVLVSQRARQVSSSTRNDRRR